MTSYRQATWGSRQSILMGHSSSKRGAVPHPDFHGVKRSWNGVSEFDNFSWYDKKIFSTIGKKVLELRYNLQLKLTEAVT